MTERSGRVSRWVWLVLGLTIISCPASWLLFHRLSTPTEPRWTEADLPAPPAPADNGWVVVEGAPSVSEIELASFDTLLESDSIGLRVASFYDARSAMQTIGRERAPEIDALVAALELPRYADACPVELDASCRHLLLIKAFALLAARTYDMASRDDFAGAFDLAHLILARHTDYARSARSLVACAIGAMLLLRAITLVETLDVLGQRESLPPEDWAASRAAIVQTLDDIALRPFDATNGVISEYVFFRRAMPAELSLGAASPWLTDRRATTAHVDDLYGELYAYAEGSSATLPAVDDPLERPLWWLHNPRGKMMLSVLLVGASGPLRRIVDQRAEAARRAGELHTALAALD